MSELIIDDTNWQQHVSPSLNTGFVARTLFDNTEGYGAPASFPLIPRSDWKRRIDEMEQTESRLSDICRRENIPVLNQGQLPYCHAYSPALALMAQRAVQGLPFVLLSPGSIGGPATGYKAKGAWIGSDLKVITTLGCASQEFVPHNQVSKSGWKPGAEANALQHRVSEWWDLPARSFDHMMTLLFARIPVCTGHNWWGHAVTAFDPVYKDGKYGARFRNSWGASYGEDGWFILMEGKGTPDEAYAPRQVVTG